MHDMYDAVNPHNLPAFLKGAPALHITVLANATGQAFDSETGNAGVAAVAGAVETRQGRGLWSILYTDESNLAALTEALGVRGLHWTDASDWPKPAVYLWCATGGSTPGLKPAWAPVTPIAVQDRYPGNFDVSSVADQFPGRVAGYIDGPRSAWAPVEWEPYTTIVSAAPQPPPVAPKPVKETCTVLLPILAVGATGDVVITAQKLLGTVAVDGDFGVITEANVKVYQEHHGLAVDGVIGQHTWGSLLGAPQ